MTSEHENPPMIEHEFALILAAPTELDPATLDALFESGCDDATPGVRSGRVFLAFTRSAPSLQMAVVSAIRDVMRSGIGASVLRVDGLDSVAPAQADESATSLLASVNSVLAFEYHRGQAPHLIDEVSQAISCPANPRGG
jgi:hypothetical protein